VYVTHPSADLDSGTPYLGSAHIACPTADILFQTR
jgi:hypothetical protein